MTASLRQQADELLLIGQERAAHILILRDHSTCLHAIRKHQAKIDRGEA